MIHRPGPGRRLLHERALLADEGNFTKHEGEFDLFLNPTFRGGSYCYRHGASSQDDDEADSEDGTTHDGEYTPFSPYSLFTSPDPTSGVVNGLIQTWDGKIRFDRGKPRASLLFPALVIVRHTVKPRPVALVDLLAMARAMSPTFMPPAVGSLAYGLCVRRKDRSVMFAYGEVVFVRENLKLWFVGNVPG
ncbi:hypothetical protein BJY00DRAFT_313583 [Aspergillus carlsbadensis]|nr:hypothetical protein BJY00DRAFT_313583 [Aspergillus carlsbadensis]